MSTTPANPSNGLSYRDAGVDIDRGEQLVERIKPLARATGRPEMLGGLGGFGALMRVPLERYRDPVLVSGTDGVGTKLRLAIDLERHRDVGIDLVAMCVNDVVSLGAEPFFFLDYFATGRLDVDVATAVVAGIADGCQQAGAALVGGETAEMPGMYAREDYDLAGFCVGLVEHNDIVDGHTIQAGDALIGIASSGPHANGYSLIRKVLENSQLSPGEVALDGISLADALMKPTRIYVSCLKPLLDTGTIKGLAHITGGGLTENVPRMLPAGLGAQISPKAWPEPDVFRWLRDTGGIAHAEMRRTFNCGIGMVACVAPDRLSSALAALGKEAAWPIGEVIDDAAHKVSYSD